MTDDTSNISESAKDNNDSAATSCEDSSAVAVPGVGRTEKEIGGRDGPDPTRYGDWEKKGRCIDF